jgi:hypothetical protein
MLYLLPFRSWLTAWRSLSARQFKAIALYAFIQVAIQAAVMAFAQTISRDLQPAAARRAFVAAVVCLCLMTSTIYSGDANAVLTGAGLWTEVKNLFFTEWGLVIGAVVLLVAIGGTLKYGIGWGFATAGVCSLFFLVPGGLATMQNWGKNFAS